jgi:hypothetical protein
MFTTKRYSCLVHRPARRISDDERFRKIMANDTNGRALDPTEPARKLIAVTPNDETDLPSGVARSIFVGTAGVVELADGEGNRVRLVSGPSQYHPVRVRRILATGSTAGNILALY